MYQLPKIDSIPSLIYPSLRKKILDSNPKKKKTEGATLRTEMAYRLNKLRSTFNFVKHTSHKIVNRAMSLPNVSQLARSTTQQLNCYDKEDESEMILSGQSFFRYSQLALPPKRLFQKSSTTRVSFAREYPDEVTAENDNQSLISSYSTDDEDEDEECMATLARSTTAIFVSLPMSSAAAASIAKSRRIRPVRVRSSPSLGIPL
ncbi:hypothetical protein BY458DRAFT_486117 [Sporodiniella umbellata]|nr:hypothetical protein BY458DRAFT_486117 [Sporodiniella umbellata]